MHDECTCTRALTRRRHSTVCNLNKRVPTRMKNVVLPSAYARRPYYQWTVIPVSGRPTSVHLIQQFRLHPLSIRRGATGSCVMPRVGPEGPTTACQRRRDAGQIITSPYHSGEQLNKDVLSRTMTRASHFLRQHPLRNLITLTMCSKLFEIKFRLI